MRKNLLSLSMVMFIMTVFYNHGVSWAAEANRGRFCSAPEKCTTWACLPHYPEGPDEQADDPPSYWYKETGLANPTVSYCQISSTTETTRCCMKSIICRKKNIAATQADCEAGKFIFTATGTPIETCQTAIKPGQTCPKGTISRR